MVSSKRKLIITLAFCIASLTIGLLSGNAISIQFANASQEDVHHNESSKYSDNALQTKNRDKLVVCVDNVSANKEGSNSTEKLITIIKPQIEKLKKENKKWINAYGRFPFEIKSGCSFSPLLNDANALHPIYSGHSEFERVVATPSSELFAIFVVDQSVIDKHFSNVPSRWVPEQYLCEDQECNEITKGIYLTSSEIQDPGSSILHKELLHGFSLEDVLPPVDLKKQAEDRLKKQQEISKNQKIK
jgi:hypothetical protein